MWLQGAAGVAVQYLGYTPGLFIVGLFAILILWMYANFWITGTLFIVGGMLLLLIYFELMLYCFYMLYYSVSLLCLHGIGTGFG